MKNESQTRKEIIDYQLKIAGWNVHDYSQVVEEYSMVSKAQEISSDYGTTFSDYVLLGKDGKSLAVIKAKNFQRRGNC